MKTITRAKYLDRIIELNGTPDIKIITGIRRSGKSKLMQAYIAYLKNNFENINIIFIDFMDLAYEEIKEYHALHAYVEEHYQEGKTNYLFVDEVQMCPKFELAINSLYSKGKYDIYVTGSNAFLLSADLATLFTGRYIEIHVFPFSFQEYCQYYDDISDKDKSAKCIGGSMMKKHRQFPVAGFRKDSMLKLRKNIRGNLKIMRLSGM